MNKLIAHTIALTLCTSPVFASQASTASLALSEQGFSEIVQGSAHLLAGGSELTIAAIRTVGDVTYITLRVAEGSATATIKVSREITGNVLLRTGELVEGVTTATGMLIQKSGRVIAFIPNAMGRDLLSSQRF